MYNPEFADATTLRDGLVGRNVVIGVDRAQGESQVFRATINPEIQINPDSNSVGYFTLESVEFYSEPNNSTHKIEQAKDSINPYKANLEAAGWTDLQDVELCSGRETWGCPPGGVCPRKITHEDIQPWVLEKLSEKSSVLSDKSSVLTHIFQQQSNVMRLSTESLRELSYRLSNLQPQLPGEEVPRDFEGGENE